MGCGASAPAAHKAPSGSAGADSGAKPGSELAVVDLDGYTAPAGVSGMAPAMAADQQEEQAAKAIAAAQQSQIKSGTAVQHGSSIRLDPAYAEKLRQKALKNCDRVGGIGNMFRYADVDGSKTIDVHEFRKLMLFCYDSEQHAASWRSNRQDPETVVGIDGKRHELSEPHKKIKQGKLEEEKPLTKRESTALFWHLDEDDSDCLERDEFEAWLRTGERLTEHRSYRKKPKVDERGDLRAIS